MPHCILHECLYTLSVRKSSDPKCMHNYHYVSILKGMHTMYILKGMNPMYIQKGLCKSGCCEWSEFKAFLAKWEKLLVSTGSITSTQS